MALVVCQPCHDCKYTDCVTVCPVDCFYEDAQQLYIDPEECIDCMACIPECPVEAIFHETEVPSRWSDFIRLNAERSAALEQAGANITQKREPLLGPTCAAAN